MITKVREVAAATVTVTIRVRVRVRVSVSVRVRVRVTCAHGLHAFGNVRAFGNDLLEYEAVSFTPIPELTEVVSTRCPQTTVCLDNHGV